MITNTVPLLLLVHSLATDPSLILDSLLEGKPHLDELYGSGDFKYNKNDVDSHYAFSVESLVRLFKIEKRFIQDLQSLYFNIGEKVETQNCNKTVLPELAPPQLSDEEFLSAPPVGLYRIQSLHNISISSLTKARLREFVQINRIVNLAGSPGPRCPSLPPQTRMGGLRPGGSEGRGQERRSEEGGVAGGGLAALSGGGGRELCHCEEYLTGSH